MDITFVREHIKGLQDKVKKVDNPDMILHSAALGGALSLTNGTRGDIPSISDQMAILTAVVVGDKHGKAIRREFPTMFSIADRAKKHREKKAVKK